MAARSFTGGSVRIWSSSCKMAAPGLIIPAAQGVRHAEGVRLGDVVSHGVDVRKGHRLPGGVVGHLFDLRDQGIHPLAGQEDEVFRLPAAHGFPQGGKAPDDPFAQNVILLRGKVYAPAQLLDGLDGSPAAIQLIFRAHCKGHRAACRDVRQDGLEALPPRRPGTWLKSKSRISTRLCSAKKGRAFTASSRRESSTAGAPEDAVVELLRARLHAALPEPLQEVLQEVVLLPVEKIQPLRPLFGQVRPGLAVAVGLLGFFCFPLPWSSSCGKE